MATLTACGTQASQSLRAAFGVQYESWLGCLQGIIDAEVERVRAELLSEVAQRRQQAEAEWAKLLTERERFQQERNELALRQGAFEREKASMQGLRQATDVIDLNVGGQTFCSVKRSTLCLVGDSALGSMFSGRWESSLEKDGAGRVFVDFPPDLFMPLVNYLRQRSIEDPAEPTEPPNIPQEKLSSFKRMLTYYGLLDTVWPRPEGKWEIAWGHISINDEERTIRVSSEGDTYQAAAFNTMRLRCSSRLGYKLRISKSRMDAPWFYDSVAFGVVGTSFHGHSMQCTSKSDLLLNLKGNVKDEFDGASVDLGGIPAEQPSFDVELTVRGPNLVMSFNDREHMSVPVPAGVHEASCCLLVAVTYPWIRVKLQP